MSSNWYDPERPAQVGSVAIKEPERSGIFAAADISDVDWPEELIFLPRTMACNIEKDLSIPSGERKNLVERAQKGDADAVEKVNTCLNVVLEMMGRYQVQRQAIDPNSGEPMFVDRRTGRPTTTKYYEDPNNKNRWVENPAAMEMRSPWGVRPGAECRSAPRTEMPKPGHWKLAVIQNFYDLLPRLKFLSEVLDGSEPDPNGAKPELKASYDAHLRDVNSNSHWKRRELLAWLKDFLKNPKTTWNGLD